MEFVKTCVIVLCESGHVTEVPPPIVKRRCSHCGKRVWRAAWSMDSGWKRATAKPRVKRVAEIPADRLRYALSVVAGVSRQGLSAKARRYLDDACDALGNAGNAEEQGQS